MIQLLTVQTPNWCICHCHCLIFVIVLVAVVVVVIAVVVIDVVVFVIVVIVVAAATGTGIGGDVGIIVVDRAFIEGKSGGPASFAGRRRSDVRWL